MTRVPNQSSHPTPASGTSPAGQGRAFVGADDLNVSRTNMSISSPPRTRASVLWTIWIAIVGGMLVYQFKLGGGIPTGVDARSNAGNPIVWLAVAQIVAASAIRWFVLPRFSDLQKRLVFMIVGLALSQSVTFFGIFLFTADMPHTKMELFWLSFLSAIQFIPFFASDKLQNQNG